MEREDYEGKENVEVRYKYFDLRSEQYLREQMHSKYMIVDGKEVLTGSFNWSISSEYNHIENLVRLDNQDYPEALDEFEKDFDLIWNLNRSIYETTLNTINKDLKESGKTDCSIEAMTLTSSEIDRLKKKYKKGICL